MNKRDYWVLRGFAILLVVVQLGTPSLADVPSDATILNRLYKGPPHPPNFYSEPSKNSKNRLVYTSWVTKPKNIRRRKPEATAYFLPEALSMLKSMIKDDPGAELGAVVSTRKTARFFEITTRKKGDDYDTQYRVWNAKYFLPGEERVTSHWRSDKVKLGTFKGSLDEKEVREFAELLWWKDNYQTAGAVVLQPPTVQTTDNVITVSILAGHMVFGDWNMKDSATLEDWVLTVNRKTGLVTYGFDTRKTIFGNQNGPAIIDLNKTK